MKKYFFILLTFILIPCFLFSQVKVNEQSNVGIKTNNLLDNVSLSIENSGNKHNIYSTYNYTGDVSNLANGSFVSFINSSKLFKGLYSFTRNEGSGSVAGVYSIAESDSYGQVVGIRNYAQGIQQPRPNGTYPVKYGMMNYVTGNSSVPLDSDEGRTGIYTSVQGDGNGEKIGLAINIQGNGDGRKRGIHNVIYQGGSGHRLGIDSKVYGDGDGGRIGIENHVHGTGAGSRIAFNNYVYGFTDGPYTNNIKYGMINKVYGIDDGTDSDEIRIGIVNDVHGDGLGDKTGLSNVVTGNSTTLKRGIVNVAAGDSDANTIGLYTITNDGGAGYQEGIRNYVTGNSDSYKIGIRNYVYENGGYEHIGLYNYVYGDNGTDDKFGIYNRVNTQNSNNVYGVYSYVDGASSGNNFAGYFIGDVHIVGNLTTTMSDRRLKKDIRPLENTLDKLMALKTVRFNYKTDRIPLPKEHQIGLIAQEVEQLFPEVVRETSMVIPDKGNPKDTEAIDQLETEKYKAVNYEKLVPILIKSIQEQQTQIIQLENRIKELEASKK